MAKKPPPDSIAKKPNKNKPLTTFGGAYAIAHGQGVLDLKIEKQREVNGVGMGVLTDGTPFLTGRGLARLCGISNARIVELSGDWKDENRSLTKQVKKLLAAKGVVVSSPHIAIEQSSGTFYAYPDALCIAVLEFYAFDAGVNIRQRAIDNFRILAGKALQEFIYTQVGYDPRNEVPGVWKQFHDRVSLTYSSVLGGYFGVFKEIAARISQIDNNFTYFGRRF